MQAMGGRGYAFAARRDACATAIREPYCLEGGFLTRFASRLGGSLKDASIAVRMGAGPPVGSFLRMESCGALWHVQRRLPG